MKRILNLSVLTCLLFATSNSCFAMISIAHVSKGRATEPGMVSRLKTAGHATTVELQFEIQSELKDFSRVELEIRDGEKRVSTALTEERPGPERVAVSFTAAHGSRDKFTLRVVTQSGAREMTGYDLQMKDFVEPEKPAAAAPHGAPMGRLGSPLETYLAIEGVRSERGKGGTRRLLVNKLGDQQLDPPVGLWIENIALPEGVRRMLKGYESGRWIEIPDKVLEATGEPVPQTPSQFFIHFPATSVEQPATLKIKQP